MKIPGIPNFEEWFAGTEEGQAAVAEYTEATTAERQADVDRLAEIEKEVLRGIVEPMKVIKKVTAETLKAHEVWMSKQRDLNVAKSEEMNVRQRADRERAVTEQR